MISQGLGTTMAHLLAAAAVVVVGFKIDKPDRALYYLGRRSSSFCLPADLVVSSASVDTRLGD
jgi:hypothetical protein